MASTSIAAGGVILLLSLIYLWTKSRRKLNGRLPPGPRPKPIIGNLLDMPQNGTRQELHWTKHKELYGPISHLDIFGQHILIVNDYATAHELLDKRSAKWSTRPQLTFAGEMLGYGHTMLFVPANSDFRDSRKIVQHQFGSNTAIQRWGSDLDIEVRRFLLRTLEQPDQFVQHLRKEAGSIILKIVYGYNVEPHGSDTLVDLMAEVMDILAVAAVPGDWLVDAIPALRFLPDWLPGMNFKRLAKSWRSKVLASAVVPFGFTDRQISRKQAPLSLVSEAIKKQGGKNEISIRDLDLIKWAAVSMYAAGSDTTVAVMEIFFMVMVLYPAVQRKLQTELDAVVGNHRLPDPSDRPQLPYLEAVMKETARWQPIGEVIPPHQSTEDDHYKDYFLPKGSMVLVNAAGMFHDPKVYHDPDKYNPERFLGDSPEQDPSDVIWGFGRRVCPGRWLATANVWLAMARTAAVFNIAAVPGHEPKLEFTYGLVRRPEPYKADIKVRSTEHEKLIRKVADQHPFPEHGDAAAIVDHYLHGRENVKSPARQFPMPQRTV